MWIKKRVKSYEEISQAGTSIREEKAEYCM